MGLRSTKMLKMKIMTRIRNAIMVIAIENLRILQVLLKKIASLVSKLIRLR